MNPACRANKVRIYRAVGGTLRVVGDNRTVGLARILGHVLNKINDFGARRPSKMPAPNAVKRHIGKAQGSPRTV